MDKQELISIAKPILFNTEMVHAILNGSKTMTRRVVKPQPCSHFSVLETLFSIGGRFPYNKNDILYVRETWGTYKQNNKEIYIFKTYGTNTNTDTEILQAVRNAKTLWHPSIHMPKKAARIFLRVTNVRVERLQDITMDDMKAEGVIPKGVTGGQWEQWQHDYMKPMWNKSVNPKNNFHCPYWWDVNPWVWVVSFEKIGYTNKEEV